MPRCKNPDCGKKFKQKYFLQKFCMEADECINLEYQLKSKKPIKTESDKRQAERKIYEESKRVYMLEHFICEMPGCTKSSTDLHHKRGRVGSDYYDENFFMSVCRFHHAYIHANPEESYDKGWLISKTKGRV